MPTSRNNNQGAAALTTNQREFAEQLLRIGAVKFGAFRMKLHESRPDAPLSPIYIDLRLLQSSPDAMDTAVAVLVELLNQHGLKFDCYADIPLGSLPLVALLSHTTRVPMITPILPANQEESGTIDGVFTPGSTVLLIDDLVTYADSKVDSIRVLEAHGLKVRDVAVLLDRQQGAGAKLAALGYALHAATGLGQLLDYWHIAGAISDDQFLSTSRYLDQESGE